MTLNALALDLAHDLIHERLQRAALDALAREVPHSAPTPSLAGAVRAHFANGRAHLAHGLRGLACRLDPALSCSR